MRRWFSAWARIILLLVALAALAVGWQAFTAGPASIFNASFSDNVLTAIGAGLLASLPLSIMLAVAPQTKRSDTRKSLSK